MDARRQQEMIRNGVVCITCSECIGRCRCPRMREHELSRIVEPAWVQPSIWLTLVQVVVIIAFIAIVLWWGSNR